MVNSIFFKILKIWRFVWIHGFSRTLYKLIGRYRRLGRFISGLKIWKFRGQKYNVGVIGCGQFAFATVGYFLGRSGRYRFARAYDPDVNALDSFCEFYRVGEPVRRVEDFEYSDLDVVYIASNHASHSEYAIQALRQGVSAYVEKPVSVNWDQFRALGAAVSEHRAEIFVGYNRPFSKAIETLKRLNAGVDSPFTLSCFVVGHFIESDHWYRDPAEGTRVCGNLGHWLDLSVHLLFTKALPEFLDIRLSVADREAPDDNLSVSITSSNGDLINLILTSRAEPFEGINETVSFNQDDLIATITDFGRPVSGRGIVTCVKNTGPRMSAIGRPYFSTYTGTNTGEILMRSECLRLLCWRLKIWCCLVIGSCVFFLMPRNTDGQLFSLTHGIVRSF